MKFYLNGTLIQDCPDQTLFVGDNPNLGHYIGGIRHNWDLKDPFSGFIYEVNLSNYVKADFTSTLFDSCGDCWCTVDNGTCLSNC